MKKFFIGVLIMFAISVINQKVMAVDYLVVKKGKTITVCEIADFDNSPGKNITIFQTNLKDLMASEFGKCIPEDAWSLCLKEDDGFYDSYSQRLEIKNAILKNDLITSDADYKELSDEYDQFKEETDITSTIIYGAGFILFLFLMKCFCYIRRLRKTVKKLEKLIPPGKLLNEKIGEHTKGC